MWNYEDISLNRYYASLEPNPEEPEGDFEVECETFDEDGKAYKIKAIVYAEPGIGKYPHVKVYGWDPIDDISHLDPDYIPEDIIDFVKDNYPHL